MFWHLYICDTNERVQKGAINTEINIIKDEIMKSVIKI